MIFGGRRVKMSALIVLFGTVHTVHTIIHTTSNGLMAPYHLSNMVLLL